LIYGPATTGTHHPRMKQTDKRCRVLTIMDFKLKMHGN